MRDIWRVVRGVVWGRLMHGAVGIDHNIVFTPYFASPESDTLDPVIMGDSEFIAGVSDLPRAAPRVPDLGYIPLQRRRHNGRKTGRAYWAQSTIGLVLLPLLLQY